MFYDLQVKDIKFYMIDFFDLNIKFITKEFKLLGFILNNKFFIKFSSNFLIFSLF